MNKTAYIVLIIWLQSFGLATTANSADLRYIEINQLDWKKDEHLDEQKSPNSKVTLIDTLNLAKNYFSFLSLEKLTAITSANVDCDSLLPAPKQTEENDASVNFLPQVKAIDIFKGIYDFAPNSVCIVNDDQTVVNNDIFDQEGDNDAQDKQTLVTTNGVSSVNKQRKSPESVLGQGNYESFPTVQELNALTNNNRQIYNYLKNYKSLKALNIKAIKPLANNSIILSQSSQIEYSLNYLNAQGNQEIVRNYKKEIKLPSSPILNKINTQKERELQQIKKQEQKAKELSNKWQQTIKKEPAQYEQKFIIEGQKQKRK
jgi:hypothetical protein